jgi:hypothetical protein
MPAVFQLDLNRVWVFGLNELAKAAHGPSLHYHTLFRINDHGGGGGRVGGGAVAEMEAANKVTLMAFIACSTLFYTWT